MDAFDTRDNACFQALMGRARRYVLSLAQKRYYVLEYRGLQRGIV